LFSQERSPAGRPVLAPGGTLRFWSGRWCTKNLSSEPALAFVEVTEVFAADLAVPQPAIYQRREASRRNGASTRANHASLDPPEWRTMPRANSSGNPSSTALASALTKPASVTSTSNTARSPSSFMPVESSALRSHDLTSASSGHSFGQPRSIAFYVQQRPETVPQHGQAKGGALLHQTRSRCRLNASCALILPSTRSRFISSTVPAATQT
jgi:hypothetical protein